MGAGAGGRYVCVVPSRCLFPAGEALRTLLSGPDGNRENLPPANHPSSLITRTGACPAGTARQAPGLLSPLRAFALVGLGMH